MCKVKVEQTPIATNPIPIFMSQLHFSSNCAIFHLNYCVRQGAGPEGTVHHSWLLFLGPVPSLRPCIMLNTVYLFWLKCFFNKSLFTWSMISDSYTLI